MFFETIILWCGDPKRSKDNNGTHFSINPYIDYCCPSYLVYAGNTFNLSFWNSNTFDNFIFSFG